MSAKYPLKVKLDLFSQLQSAREGWIMRTLIWEGIGVFIVVRIYLTSLESKFFLYRSLLEES